jgi:O-antigen ligase
MLQSLIFPFEFLYAVLTGDSYVMRPTGKWISLIGLLVFSASTSTTVVGQEIGLGFMFLGWLILWTRRAAPGTRPVSLEFPIIALAVAWTLSTIFALDPVPSLINMKKLFLIPIIYGFAWLIEDEKSLRTIVTVMLTVALIVSVYGIISYLRGSNLEESYRVRATMSSTVTLAGVLLLAFALSLSLTVSERVGKKRFLFLLATVFSFLCLTLTYTRGAWLGAIVAILLTFLLSSGRKKTASLVALVLIVIAPLASHHVRERVTSFTQLPEMSISGRFSMWLSATQVAKDHPLFGVGLMDLKEVYDRYKRPDSGFRSGHMHSDFFQVLASTGLLGLAAFLWFLRSVCGLLLRNLLSTERKEGFLTAVCLGSLAGFCGFVTAGIFEWNFGDAEVVSMLYCLIGLACACTRIQSSERSLASA